MSHTMNINVELHDQVALTAACARLGLNMVSGEHRLYGSVEEGIGITLPGWRYPVVIQEGGKIAYDNFRGSWGSDKELSKLKAYYGIEKAKAECRKKGLSFYETKDTATNELVLKIRMGGGYSDE